MKCSIMIFISSFANAEGFGGKVTNFLLNTFGDFAPLPPARPNITVAEAEEKYPALSILLNDLKGVGEAWECIRSILLYESVNKKMNLLDLAVSEEVSRDIYECYQMDMSDEEWLKQTVVLIGIHIIAFFIVTAIAFVCILYIFRAFRNALRCCCCCSCHRRHSGKPKDEVVVVEAVAEP